MVEVPFDEREYDSSFRMSSQSWYKKNIAYWSLYDLGNTIYSLVVVSLVFTPLLYIKAYGIFGDPVKAINYGNTLYATGLFISNVIMAIVSPYLGAYSDHQKKRKYLLLKISYISIAFIGALFISKFTSNLLLILIVFLFANLFYQMGLVVYDSMVPFVADKEDVGKVSAIGVAIGYFGSIVGIMLTYLLIPFFGDFKVIPKEGIFEIGYIPYIFPLVALGFLLFTLPMYAVKERPHPMPDVDVEQVLHSVNKQVITTGKEILKYRDMFMFLIGWLVFVDAANTVIAFMGPIVQVGLEFGEGQTVTLVLMLGIISAIVLTYPIGPFVDRFGPKKGFILITVIWYLALIIAFFTNLHITVTIPLIGKELLINTPKWPVYIFPIIVGPGLGGLWVIQRQMVTELAPQEKVGNYFGFTNIFGRISAAIGPYLWTASIFMFNKYGGFNINLSTRLGLLILAISMFIGFLFIIQVRDVHKHFIKGARANGKGQWVYDDGSIALIEEKPDEKAEDPAFMKEN